MNKVKEAFLKILEIDDFIPLWHKNDLKMTRLRPFFVQTNNNQFVSPYIFHKISLIKIGISEFCKFKLSFKLHPSPVWLAVQ